MDVLGIELKNCYGIQQLDASLNFLGSPKLKGSPEIPPGSAFSIYAPNGFMKTSLARTFLDFQEGRDSLNLVFPARPSSRSITSDPATPITPESVFVIKPYVERYAGAGTSTLLVNPKLRSEYEEAVRNIESTQEDLLKALKDVSGWPGKTSPASEIKEIFQFKNSYDFFSELAGNLDGDTRFSDLVYSEIFNDKTIAAFRAGTLHEQLQEYMSKFQELVGKSPLLSKKFNHAGAAEVSKSLQSNGFFDASHTLNISNGGEGLEISSAKDLEALVVAENSAYWGIRNSPLSLRPLTSSFKKMQSLRSFVST